MAASRFPRIVSLACHDLRTPLATVYGFARTLTRSGELDERSARFMGMIEEASEQMTQLLDELCPYRHPRAIRTVGRAWCRVLWQCWRNHTPFDPTRHRALQRHITVTIPGRTGPRIDIDATRRLAGPGLWRPDLTHHRDAYVTTPLPLRKKGR